MYLRRRLSLQYRIDSPVVGVYIFPISRHPPVALSARQIHTNTE